MKHDEQAACAAWLSWLQEGPSSGLGRQHQMSRVSQGWIPSKLGSTASTDDDDGCLCFSDVGDITDDDVTLALPNSVPLDLQQSVDAGCHLERCVAGWGTEYWSMLA